MAEVFKTLESLYLNDEPRQTLRALIVEYGHSLCDDPRRCEALLKDYCGAHKREIFLLISTLKHRVAEELLKASAGVPQSILFARLCRRLEDELAMTADAARWAVDSWALALGLAVERSAPPTPAPPPPVVPCAPAAPPPPAVSTASPPTAPQPLTVFQDRLRDGSAGPAMIAIPPGEFWMGSPESEPERGDDERRHRVAIARPFAIGRYAVTFARPPFAIGQYAVTFAEYDRFCAATGRERADDQGWGRDRRPVIEVDWYDALDYTDWLSEQTGQTYRLPTEAEWEYAGRAGTETPFWWGKGITIDQANYNGHYTYGPRSQPGVSRAQTVPVDQFQPNPWGLYQVHGNVWEWTGSVYIKDYSGAEQRCAGRAEDGPRSLRGGSWYNSPARGRSASRFSAAPVNRYGSSGFRLARSL